MRKWSERSLGNLRGIHPDLRRVMDRALQISPLDFIVIEGLRTPERQRQLVASGASKTLNSRHLTGHAVDLLPIGYDGKAAFDWPLYHKLAPAVKQAANELGVRIVWGGDWKSFRDGPHFELDRAVYPADAPWPEPDKSPLTRPADHVTIPPKIEHEAVEDQLLASNPVDVNIPPKVSVKVSLWAALLRFIAGLFRKSSK